MLSLLLSIYVGEELLSGIDPAPEERVCVAGEWPDDLTEGSELGSASGSCCEAVAGRTAQIKMRTCTMYKHDSVWLQNLLLTPNIWLRGKVVRIKHNDEVTFTFAIAKSQYFISVG